MELNWLESLIYGLLSGFAEFLPISSEAHRELFLKLVGAGDDPVSRLAVHLGALLAVIICCATYISKLNRERRIAAIPKKRRKRQPDLRTILDLKVLRTAGIPVVLWFAAYPFAWDQGQRLWILALALILNGILLYVPQHYPIGNKDSLNLSASDSLLIGFVSGIGVFPGISRMGGALSAAQLRGADTRFSLDISFLLFIPAAIGLVFFDFYGIFTGGATSFHFFQFLTAAAASFGGGCCGIYFMRFLAVKSGFSGFAFYSWGAALLAMLLYLVT